MRNWLSGIFAPFLPIVGCVIVVVGIYRLIPVVQSVRAMRAENRRADEMANIRSRDQQDAERLVEKAIHGMSSQPKQTAMPSK